MLSFTKHARIWTELKRYDLYNKMFYTGNYIGIELEASYSIPINNLCNTFYFIRQGY